MRNFSGLLLLFLLTVCCMALPVGVNTTGAPAESVTSPPATSSDAALSTAELKSKLDQFSGKMDIVLETNRTITSEADSALKRAEEMTSLVKYQVWFLTTIIGIIAGLLGFFGYRSYQEMKTRADGILDEAQASQKAADISQRKAEECATLATGILEDTNTKLSAATDSLTRINEIRQKAEECMKVIANFNPRNIASDQRQELNHADSYFALGKVLGNELGADAYIALGNARFSRGDYDKAVFYYDDAIKIDPNNAAAFRYKGDALCELDGDDNVREAIECYDQTIGLNKSDADAYYSKGIALMKLHMDQDALRFFDKAISLNPTFAKFYSTKGCALANLGDRDDEAIACYAEALRMYPGYYEAYTDKAALHIRRGEYPEAIAECDSSIAIKANTNAYFTRARAYALAGDSAQALADLQIAVELDERQRRDARDDAAFAILSQNPEYCKLVSPVRPLPSQDTGGEGKLDAAS